MGISALLGDVWVVTGSTVNKYASTVYFMIAYAAHTRCLAIWIVAGFAGSFLLSPPWHVNVYHAAFIGNTVTVSTRYVISSIMGGFLGLEREG
jgi:hypothetical protein